MWLANKTVMAGDVEQPRSLLDLLSKIPVSVEHYFSRIQITYPAFFALGFSLNFSQRQSLEVSKDYDYRGNEKHSLLNALSSLENYGRCADKVQRSVHFSSNLSDSQ